MLQDAKGTELMRRLEEAAKVLGSKFNGEVTMRVENGVMRWADVQTRLRREASIAAA